MSTTSTYPPSPTYTCSQSAVPLMDELGSYCVIPGGHTRMGVCCNGTTVNFRPDCYSWCNIPDSYATSEQDWMAMANGFFDCLMADGGARPSYAVCQPDTRQIAVNSQAPVTYAPYGIYEDTETSTAAAPRATGDVKAWKKTVTVVGVVVLSVLGQAA